MIAQEIWDVIMELDKDGRRLLKDEAKNKKQRERKKKKAKAKAKKRSKEGAKAPEARESKKGQAGRDRFVK